MSLQPLWEWYPPQSHSLSLVMPRHTPTAETHCNTFKKNFFASWYVIKHVSTHMSHNWTNTD
jgi:hypothetical protein